MAAVYSFDGRFWLTYAGFLLMAVGYRVSQPDSTDTSDASQSTQFDQSTERTYFTGAVTRRLGLLLAVTLISAGGYLGAQVILAPAAGLAILAGILMIGGFVVGHLVIHNSIV